MVWWSGPPDFDTQLKLRDHFDTQIKSGGLVVWWSGGLVVWWSGGPNFDTQMKPRGTSHLFFFFFGAPRPKAIFEANFIRK